MVFVGAGFSIDPPSGLPTFPSLVEQVAGAAGIPIEVDHVRLDQQLGELDEIPGFSVHAAIRELLSPPESKPNDRHEVVARLFDGATSIRIVTTNYDEHLEAAARDVSGGDIPVWSAPALPLGGGFRGVVHLHGSVSESESVMVATDADFSKAYLTQGWARRFLVDLFSNYVVLFVGYSHDDVVMRYLARGLPAGTSRFILIPERQAGDSQWQSLGVTPLSYRSAAENDHAASLEALEHWAEWSHMSFLTRRELIRNIVQSGPTLDRLDQSLLESLFADPSETRLFCESNDDPEWLPWMSRIEPFAELFKRGSPDTDVHRLLANWFVRSFAFKHPTPALQAIVSNGGQISTPLWFALAGDLQSATGLDATIRNRWIAILADRIPPGRSMTLLDYIAHNSSRPQDEEALLLLLDTLLDPGTDLRPGFASPVRVNVEMQGSEYWLGMIAQALLPRLDELGRQVYRLSTGKLEKAYRIQSLHDSSSRLDSMSLTRLAVEPHDQDAAPRSAIDVAIDLARDSSAALANQIGATQVVDDLTSFNSPVLNRIGVWLVGETEELTPDEKVQWLIESGFLPEHGFRHEVYQVLQKAFRPASDDLKVQLWEASNPDIDEYESFNLAVWLLRSDPEFTTARRFKSDASAQHGWEERDHPDLLWHMRFGWREDDDHLIETITPEQAFDAFSETPDQWFDVAQRVGATTVADPETGFKLLSEMIDRGLAIRPFWQTVLSALVRAGTSENQVQRVVDLASRSTVPSAPLEGLAEYLDDAAEQGSVESFELRQTAARTLLTCLHAAIDDESTALDPGPTDDPLTRAINSWPGRCTDFLLRATRRDDPTDPCEASGLSEFIRQVDDHGDEVWALLAGSTLGRGFYHVLAICPSTIGDVVLRWFSWDRPEMARHVWSGFAYGRISMQTADAQSAHLPALAEHLEQFEGMAKSGLLERLALMALHSEDVPDWVGTLVASTTEETRASFAHDVSRLIREALGEDSPPPILGWLRRYWADRVAGLPRTIEPGEGEAMIRWGFQLADVGDDHELIDLMLRTPLGAGISHGLVMDLEQSRLWEVDKRAGIRVLVKILESPLDLFDTRPIDQLLSDARDSGVASEQLEAACEAIARRGMTAQIQVCNEL